MNLKDPVKVVPAPVKEVVKQKETEIKAIYVVWDSLKHSIIDADISWTKRHYVASRGTGDIVLEKHTTYNVTFSSVGYKSKSEIFSTKDSVASFTHYIFLTPVKEGEDFSMDKIYFYPNTYLMKPDAAAQLEKLLNYLRPNPEVRIEIQGFTNGNNRIKASPDDFSEGSFTGTAKNLSKMRAETIRKYLLDNGVNAERLSANGYGGSRMIYAKPRNQEEADKYIRVGILVLPQKETALSSRGRSK